MKNNILRLVAAAALCIFLASCNRALVVDNINEADYNNVNTNIAMLLDAGNGLQTSVVDLRTEDVTTAVQVVLPRPADKTVRVSVRLDPRYVNIYNQKHNTSFDLFPDDCFEMEEGGVTVIEAGSKRSESIAITFNPLLDEAEGTYMLPLKAVISADGVTVSEQDMVYLVKNLKNQATAIRRPGEKSIFCFFEVNDTNPLNLLCWEMEDGRLLVDYLVLFAYNIRYNADKGEVYCHANPNCQFILDNYDQVIKPLRDRGVKVIIGLLGDHDVAGLAQLSKLGAQQFAANMASICYGYGFDGLNFDDEYSNSPDLSNPLFASHSTAAGDRLIYECKQAMPDLLMTSYQYGSCYGSGPVDGHPVAEYLDITVGDYGRAGVPRGGMTNAQCAYMSSEFALGRSLPSASSLASFVASDYGFWMIFSPWCSSNQGGKTHFDRLDTMAQGIYGSRLKKPEYYYPSTRSLETNPIAW